MSVATAVAGHAQGLSGAARHMTGKAPPSAMSPSEVGWICNVVIPQRRPDQKEWSLMTTSPYIAMSAGAGGVRDE
jgi:hypothetical protein